MTSWAKDATEFTVSVTRNVKAKTIYSYIPKPLLDMMDTPRRITFSVKNGVITVSAEKKKTKTTKPGATNRHIFAFVMYCKICRLPA